MTEENSALPLGVCGIYLCLLLRGRSISFQVVSETVSSKLRVNVVSCFNSLLCFPSTFKKRIS